MNVNTQNVWQKVTPELQSEIISFWEANGITLPDEEKIKRSQQAILIARDDNAIVGLCTAFEMFLNHFGVHFLYYRSLVSKDYWRHGIAINLVIESRDFFEEQFKGGIQTKCKGILLELENDILNQTVRDAVWPRTKFIFVGNNKKGRQMRVYYFEGAKI